MSIGSILSTQGLLVLAIADRGICIEIRVSKSGIFTGSVTREEDSRVLVSTEMGYHAEDATDWFSTMCQKLDAGELHSYSRLNSLQEYH